MFCAVFSTFLQLQTAGMTKVWFVFKFAQPKLDKGMILRLHQLHLTTYPTGDVINIFASVKN